MQINPYVFFNIRELEVITSKLYPVEVVDGVVASSLRPVFGDLRRPVYISVKPAPIIVASGTLRFAFKGTVPQIERLAISPLTVARGELRDAFNSVPGILTIGFTAGRLFAVSGSYKKVLISRVMDDDISNILVESPLVVTGSFVSISRIRISEDFTSSNLTAISGYLRIPYKYIQSISEPLVPVNLISVSGVFKQAIKYVNCTENVTNVNPIIVSGLFVSKLKSISLIESISVNNLLVMNGTFVTKVKYNSSIENIKAVNLSVVTGRLYVAFQSISFSDYCSVTNPSIAYGTFRKIVNSYSINAENILPTSIYALNGILTSKVRALPDYIVQSLTSINVVVASGNLISYVKTFSAKDYMSVTNPISVSGSLVYSSSLDLILFLEPDDGSTDIIFDS